MKVLVIGKGAREHALCWRLHSSQSVWGLFCAPGNPGIDQLARPVPIALTDTARLVEFAKENKIDLTVVGPDDPMAAGIVDEFEKAGLRIFGPTKAAAQLESSKAFAKSVMREAGVPTADFEVFDNSDAARDYAKTRRGEVVVKADGLALGKGVFVCRDLESANAAIADAMESRKFGAAGARVVIEEILRGEELSFFALCSGDDAVSFGLCQDHKTIFDGDKGPNTGGMGAYSPVPQFAAGIEERLLDEVVRPTLRAMKARGTPFRGVLFVGLMVDGNRIDVIEFNVRFGDPESEALMMRFDGDLAETLLACAEGNLAKAAVQLSPKSAVTVVLASGGYPGEYRKGIPITGLEMIEGNAPSEAKVKWAMEKTRVKVFHAGTALRDGKLVTDGGRVLAVTAISDSLQKAVAAAYQAADMINFEGKQMRRDIAHKALNFSRRESLIVVGASVNQIAGLEDAIGALRDGDLVVYPTETFYGIAADPFSSNALEKLFAIKGREANKPIALIAADSAMAFAVAREVPAIARRLATAFWPGPLTMVMPARAEIPPQLIGTDGGVGVRVSSHPIARALSAGLGRPITATSANLSGEPAASTIDAARKMLGNKVKVFLEGGILTASAPSTVITCDADGFQVIRAGAISESVLRAALSIGNSE